MYDEHDFDDFCDDIIIFHKNGLMKIRLSVFVIVVEVNVVKVGNKELTDIWFVPLN